MMEQYLAQLNEQFDGNKYKISKFTEKYGERLLYFKTIKKNDRFPDFDIYDVPFKPDIVYPTDFLPFMLFKESHSVA